MRKLVLVLCGLLLTQSGRVSAASMVEYTLITPDQSRGLDAEIRLLAADILRLQLRLYDIEDAKRQPKAPKAQPAGSVKPTPVPPNSKAAATPEVAPRTKN